MNVVKVLLAIDESPASVEAANEVVSRSWPTDTTVRVLHTVGKFVPPAQELWYDAGGSLEEAREEIKNRAKDSSKTLPNISLNAVSIPKPRSRTERQAG